MQRRVIFLLGIVLLTTSAASAQSYVESALLFSRTRVGGSARVQAMGGSQIALGGDYSSAFSNPAGLGMFNKSEFTITPAFTSYNTSSSYLGEATDASTSKINIPGISAVFQREYERGGGFVSGSFAISMNRSNDFNRSTFYQGNQNTNPDNLKSSIIDYFLADADGTDESQFDPSSGFQYNTPTGLGYYNYLIGPETVADANGDPTRYFSDVNGFPVQQEDIKSKGVNNQWNISYGTNFKDILFIGVGIGFSSLRYRSEKSYSESFTNTVLNGLNLTETLDIKGSGINGTIGATVRPVDFFQVGVSFTTPTYYEFTDTYSADMTTSWRNHDYYGQKVLGNERAGTDIITADYSLRTPMKLSTGVAFITQYGIITGDIEYADPSKASYSSQTSGLSFQSDNNAIKSTYKGVVNYRVGGEYRYNILRVRAGYGMLSNSYASDINLDNSIQSITGGVGIRLKKFFSDFALVHSSGKTLYGPYTFPDGTGPTVDMKQKMTTGMITLGFNF